MQAGKGYTWPFRSMTEDDGTVVLLDALGFHVATMEDMERVGEAVADSIAAHLNARHAHISEYEEMETCDDPNCWCKSFKKEG